MFLQCSLLPRSHELCLREHLQAQKCAVHQLTHRLLCRPGDPMVTASMDQYWAGPTLYTVRQGKQLSDRIPLIPALSRLMGVSAF